MPMIDWFIGFTSENFKKITANILKKRFDETVCWIGNDRERGLRFSEFIIISFLLIGKLIIAKRSHHGWLHIDDVIIIAKSDFCPLNLLIKRKEMMINSEKRKLLRDHYQSHHAVS